jgi:hypothetical protein
MHYESPFRFAEFGESDCSFGYVIPPIPTSTQQAEAIAVEIQRAQGAEILLRTYSVQNTTIIWGNIVATRAPGSRLWPDWHSPSPLLQQPLRRTRGHQYGGQRGGRDHRFWSSRLGFQQYLATTTLLISLTKVYMTNDTIQQRHDTTTTRYNNDTIQLLACQISLYYLVPASVFVFPLTVQRRTRSSIDGHAF